MSVLSSQLKEQNADLQRNVDDTNVAKHMPVYRMMPRIPYSTKVTKLMHLHGLMKHQCRLLHKMGDLDALDHYINRWYKRCVKNKMYDTAVVVLVQKSANFLLAGDTKTSMKYAKHARCQAEKAELEFRDYLRVLTSATLLSRYKRKDKLGKSQKYLTQVKYYSEALQEGECFGLAHWSEGGYNRSILKTCRNNEAREYVIWCKSIESYLKAMNHRLYMPETEIFYNKEKAMKSFTHLIRKKLGLTEDATGYSRHLVTVNNIELAKKCIEMLSQFYKRFSERFLTEGSAESDFFTCHLNVIWCGFYWRKGEFMMGRDDHKSEAKAALERCMSFGNAACDTASKRGFTDEKQEVEKLLKLATKTSACLTNGLLLNNFRSKRPGSSFEPSTNQAVGKVIKLASKASDCVTVDVCFVDSSSDTPGNSSEASSGVL